MRRSGCAASRAAACRVSCSPPVYNANARILQGPECVAITYEMIHDTRVISDRRTPSRRPRAAAVLRRVDRPLGRRHLRRGRHELQRQGHVPRIEPGRCISSSVSGASKRTSSATKCTVDDPATWPKPWTAALDMRSQPGGMFGMRLPGGQLRADEHSQGIEARRIKK